MNLIIKYFTSIVITLMTFIFLKGSFAQEAVVEMENLSETSNKNIESSSQPKQTKPQSLAISSLEEIKKAVVLIEVQGNFSSRPKEAEEMKESQGNYTQAAGSGFIIDSSGITITNNHIVTGRHFFMFG